MHTSAKHGASRVFIFKKGLQPEVTHGTARNMKDEHYGDALPPLSRSASSFCVFFQLETPKLDPRH